MKKRGKGSHENREPRSKKTEVGYERTGTLKAEQIQLENSLRASQ